MAEKKPSKRKVTKKVVQDMVPGVRTRKTVRTPKESKELKESKDTYHIKVTDVSDRDPSELPQPTPVDNDAPLIQEMIPENSVDAAHSNPFISEVRAEKWGERMEVAKEMAQKEEKKEEHVKHVKEEPLARFGILENSGNKNISVTPPSRAHHSSHAGTHGHKKQRKPWMLVTFAVLILCMGVIAAGVSILFSKGTIVIKPKIIALAVDTTLVAKENAPVPDLSYEEVTLNEAAQASIPAVAGAAVERKATATVVIYNDNSTTPQKLVATTRLTNTKGLLYHLVSTVTVPGQRIDASGKSIPGSIEAAIIADKAGDTYNAALSDLSGDFQLPGFSGTSKYTKIYARLKTDITGGYSGRQVTPDKSASASAETALKQALLTKLISQSKALAPKGYTLFDNAYQVTYTSLPPTLEGSSTAVVGMKATYTGYMFKTDALVRAFAKDQIAQFPAEGYNLTGVDSLHFDFTTPTSTIAKTKNFKFVLKGNMRIVGVIPKQQLAQELAGVSLSDSGAVIKRYSVIGGAYAKIFPVWMRSLPDSPDRITIQVQNE